MGGAARYITSLSIAIKAFIDRFYPRAGKKGLLVVPEVPSITEDITWEKVTRHMVRERHGGLLAGMRPLICHVDIYILNSGSINPEYRP